LPRRKTRFWVTSRRMAYLTDLHSWALRRRSPTRSPWSVDPTSTLLRTLGPSETFLYHGAVHVYTTDGTSPGLSNGQLVSVTPGNLFFTSGGGLDLSRRYVIIGNEDQIFGNRAAIIDLANFDPELAAKDARPED
jgi:hypothetical protein